MRVTTLAHLVGLGGAAQLPGGGARRAAQGSHCTRPLGARPGPGADIAILTCGHYTLLPEHQAGQPETCGVMVRQSLVSDSPLVGDLLCDHRLEYGRVAEAGTSHPAQARVL